MLVGSHSNENMRFRGTFPPHYMIYGILYLHVSPVYVLVISLQTFSCILMFEYIEKYENVCHFLQAKILENKYKNKISKK